MSSMPDVFHHLPFEQGTASIVAACAPIGRYGAAGLRYEIRLRVCRVVLFRGGQRAEQASFFGTAAVLAWIADELGPLRLDRLHPHARVDRQRFIDGIRAQLTKHGLLGPAP